MEQKPAAVPPAKIAARQDWIRHYRSQAMAPFMVLVVLSAISTGLILLTPVPAKILFDSVFGATSAPGFLIKYNRTDQLLYVLAFLMVALLVTQRLAVLALSFSETYYRFRLRSQVERDFYLHMMRLPQNVKHYRKHEDYINQLTTKAGAIAERLLTTRVQLAQAALMIIGIVIVLSIISLSTAMLSLIIVSPLYLSLHYFNGKKPPLKAQGLDVRNKITQFVRESIMGSDVVQAFNRETTQQGNFFDMQSFDYRLKLKKMYLRNARQSVEGGLYVIACVALALVGGKAVIDGFLTSGQLLIFVFYIVMVHKPLALIYRAVEDYHRQNADIESTFDFIFDLPEQKNTYDSPLRVARANGQLVFQNVVVTVNYKPLLNGINLTIEPGQKVAIIGPSGSGKSAILSLPPRLNSWASGTIYLDGQDVHAYDLNDLRKQFSYVEQHPTVFSDTIFGNVAFGRADGETNLAEATAALGAAGAYDFVKSLPKGLDTTIGSAGEVKLTHAQEQQIAIARAFMHNAPILLLDEPFSYVEGDRGAVLRSLTELMKGRTTLMVTHDLELLEKVDAIYVIENGVLRDVNEYGGIAAYHDVLQALTPADQGRAVN